MSDTGYPRTVDGKELSVEQRQLFDVFMRKLDNLKAQRKRVLRRYWQAKAAGRDPQLSTDDRMLLWLFGDVDDEGASAQ